MRRFQPIITIFLLLITSNLVFSQFKYLKRKDKEVETRYLIDYPTANIIPGRGIQALFRSYANGGALFGMMIGLDNRMMISGSFGGENILGEGEVKWNKSPGIGVRYLIKPEHKQYPNFSIGFNSQGYGAWQDSTSRYRIKSPGFYGVISKNQTVFNGLSMHAGINYSLEKDDEDNDLNVFVGVSWILDPIKKAFSVHAEYDFAINDNGERSLGAGKGYLNVGIKWAFLPKTYQNRLYLEFDVRNILKNTKVYDDDADVVLYNNRILKIVWMDYL